MCLCWCVCACVCVCVCVCAQVACRRRTVVWADLIRSAWGGGAAGRAASQAHGASSTSLKMDECVREAAPYCLHAQWSVDVDREMVMLQVGRLPPTHCTRVYGRSLPQ